MSVQSQYFDADGREITEAQATDRGVIRDGVRFRARVQLIDGIPQIFQTNDAERIFADSIKGKRAIELARRAHYLAERHKLNPLPFTDAHAAAVVRAELGFADSLPDLKASRDAALQARNDALNSGRRS